jgi:hypothetical protein
LFLAKRLTANVALNAAGSIHDFAAQLKVLFRDILYQSEYFAKLLLTGISRHWILLPQENPRNVQIFGQYFGRTNQKSSGGSNGS